MGWRQTKCPRGSQRCKLNLQVVPEYQTGCSPSSRLQYSAIQWFPLVVSTGTVVWMESTVSWYSMRGTYLFCGSKSRTMSKLKGPPSDFTRQIQFTGHWEYYTPCENSCALSSLQLWKSLRNLLKLHHLGIWAWAWRLKLALQTWTAEIERCVNSPVREVLTKQAIELHNVKCGTQCVWSLTYKILD